MNSTNETEVSEKSVIFCVDDDLFVLQLLGLQLNELLPNNNMLIEFATDPSSIMQKIDELIADGYCIQLIITDYLMPKMSGHELLYAVRLKYPHIKCILLSGQADKFEIRELLQMDMITSFINKPWSFRDLRTALENIQIPFNSQRNSNS